MASEDISAAEKLQIASHFILSSPPGQLKDVAADVKTIVGDDSVLSNQVLNNLKRQYNTQHFTVAKKDGELVIVSTHGEVDATHYLDPKTNTVFSYDHATGEASGSSPNDKVVDAQTESYRKQIESAVGKYMESMYGEGKYAFAVYAKDNGSIVICLSGRSVNLPAFWSGAWRASYTLDSLVTGAHDLKGSVKVNVHYFEDGNVQLNTSLDKELSVRVEADAENTAKSVAAAIDRIESEFHKQLEEFYINMNQNTFKSMRRFLPVTRKPMDWSSQAHKIAADLNK